MNYKIFLFLILSLGVLSCSNDDNNEPPSENPPPETNGDLKYISEIGGSDKTTFIYKDNLLVKGWEQNSGVFFEVEYNSQNKVDKVYTCKCGTSVNGSTLNIREDYPNDYLTFEYFYNNGQLSEIKSRSGKVLTRLKYNANNQVIEHYSAIKYCDDYDYYELTKYIYDSSGAIESYTYFESYSEQGKSGKIEVDNKVNPLNVIWKKFGLILPDNISQISKYNVPFFDHNVISIYNLNELQLKATINYEENYPIYYKEIYSQVDGTIIKYRKD